MSERDELRSHFLNDPKARRAALEPATEGTRQARPKSLREIIPNVFGLAIPEHQWLVDGLLAEGSLNLLAGSPGQYKTWLALEISRAIAHGTECLGRATRKRLVLYADLENSVAEIRRRLEVLGFAETGDFLYWGMHCDPAPVQIGSELYLEFVTSEQAKPLIVFDSLVRFSPAENENDAAQMAQVMASLRLLASRGATILVLHHSGKSPGSKVRGSSDITAGPDTVLHIATDDDGTIHLKTAKTRFSEPFELRFKFDPDSGGPVFRVSDDSAGDKRRKEAQTVVAFVASSPGNSLRQVVAALQGKVPNHRVREILGHEPFRRLDGPRNATLFYPAEDSGDKNNGETSQCVKGISL